MARADTQRKRKRERAEKLKENANTKEHAEKWRCGRREGGRGQSRHSGEGRTQEMNDTRGGRR